MPSRDLVVQNQDLRKQVLELSCAAETQATQMRDEIRRLRAEVNYLQGELQYARNWRGLGIASEPVVYFPIPPERKVAIPMSQAHCTALSRYLESVNG